MSWQYNPYVLPLLITAVVSVALAVYALRRRSVSGAVAFAVLMLGAAEWSLGYAVELGSVDLSTKVFWSNVNFVAIAVIPTAWWIFALQHAGQGRWLTRRNLALLAIEPLVTLLLAWTNEAHGLLRSDVRLDTSGPVPMLAVTYSTGFWVYVIYSYLLILFATLLLLRVFMRSPRLYRGQIGASLVSLLIPFVGNALHIYGWSPFPHLDLTPFSFTLSGLVLAWGLFRFRLFDLLPVARDAVIESMDDGVMVLDMQNRVVDINLPAARIIGRSVSEMIGQPGDQALSAWPGLVECNGDVTETRTEIVLDVDKVQRYYDLRISPLYDQRSRLSGRLFVLRNITDRKRAEELLQEERETFFSILQKAPYGVLLIDQEERCLYVNPEFTNITGHTLDDIPTVTDWLRQAFPDPTYRLAVIERWQSDTIRRIGRAFSVVCEGGKVKEVEFRSTLLDDGRAILMLSDITERERVEEALRESEHEKAMILSSVSELVTYQDTELRIVWANRAAGESVGLPTDELVGRHCYEVWHRRSEPCESCPVVEALETGEPQKGEQATPDGRIWSIRGYPVQDESGYMVGAVEVTLEITERKQAEEALRASENRLRQAQQLAHVGHWDWDMDTGELRWSEEVFRIFEQDSKSFRPTVETLESTIHPADLDKFISERDHALAEKRDISIEHRIVCPNGTVRHVHELAEIIRDDRGIVARVMGTVQDITERRRTEIELQQLASVVRHTSELVNLATLEGQMIFINKAGGKMLGINPEQVEQHVIYQVIPEHLLPKVQQEVVPSIVEKGGWEGELQYVNIKTNELIDVYAITFMVTDPNTGAPLFLANVSHNITERKLMEEERERLLAQIHEQVQRMQQIMDTVPEGVLLLDADQQIIVANPVAEGHLSVLTEVKVGDTLTRLGDRLLTELLASPPRGLWHEVATDGQSFQVIARSIETSPTPSGWVLVTRDVTQQREIEQRVQQQEQLAAVGQLAAGIAHDFNNIMATIVLYAQMTARMEGLPATVQRRMETIDQQAKHATNLIQQILDYSRRAVLERRPLDLLPLLKEQVRLLERTLPENIEIELDYGPDEYATPFTVNADPTRMQQMVTNLALNARDAMPEGGILRIELEQIEVTPGESPLLPEIEAGKWVQVTVSDTGTGIPPDVLPHIFEPFFTTKEPGRGSGLGLPQVHGIVGAHEGRIDVETQVEKGTTFTIHLPVYLSEPLSDVSSKELPAFAVGQGETVLVVEDNAVVREALVESLQLLNYKVLEATDGRRALAMLEQHRDEIDLLLSDVVMPGLGGVALLHALRERGLAVPVVLLTGHPLEKEMEELRTRGMIDWLPKPPRLEELAEVMASVLNR